MKISGAHIELRGRLVRRKDGALTQNNVEGGWGCLPFTKDMADGYPEGERPSYSYQQKKEYDEWHRKWTSFHERALSSDAYKRAVAEFVEKQRSEPCWISYNECAYQDKIYEVEADGLDPTERSLLVKHFALRQQLAFKRISKEIQAFENLERMTHREVIPESVRIFVWQRDGGKCVECGRRDSLEFDHIIPVADGGASTERNVQLRCTPCNQRKGKNV